MDEQMLDRLRRGPWNSPDLNDVFAQADGIATIPAGVATDLGFTPSQAREILSHVPNGDFAETPPDTSSNISDVTNKLPDWSFVTVAGSSITARVVADSSAGSGYVVRFSGASGSTNDEAYIEAIVPIASSRARRIGHLVRAHFLAASTATSTFQVKVQFDYLKSDASTTTGTAVTDSNNFVTSADHVHRSERQPPGAIRCGVHPLPSGRETDRHELHHRDRGPHGCLHGGRP